MVIEDLGDVTRAAVQSRSQLAWSRVQNWGEVFSKRDSRTVFSAVTDDGILGGDGRHEGLSRPVTKDNIMRRYCTVGRRLGVEG